MTQYSKAIGALLGGVIGLLATQGIEFAWATPEWVDNVAMVAGSILGTYLAPRNQYPDA